MDSNNASNYTNAAKEWISSLTGVSVASMNVFKFEKKDQNYEVGVEISSIGKGVRYLVVVGESGNIVSHKEIAATPAGGSAGTLLTVAMAFSILFVVLFLIESILAIVAFSAFFFAAGPPIFNFIPLVLGVIYIAFFIVSIYCLLHILKIRGLYNDGQYEEAYNLNSVGFGILTLIFNGLVAGILMLIARGSMKPS